MRSKITLWLAPLLLALTPFLAHTQNVSTGSIHGHVQDPIGNPMANVQVILTLNGKDAKYTFNTDQNGSYKGDGIAPDTYAVMVSNAPGKMLDRVLNIKIAAGADILQDFDLSRPDYIASLPPDARQAIEETKAKNAAIIKDNQSVSKLNTLLTQARQDNQQKKFDEAATLMQQAVQAKPDVAVLWLELGIAQAGLKKNDDAINSLKKALDLNATSSKPNPEITGAANNSLGEAYVGANKIPEATAAYDAAAKALPAKAGLYYLNETIVLGRAGNSDATVAAADKAIAADPNQPIPYYLKGQALIGKATVDPKTSRIVAPPGTAEAYQKYLQLAPSGQFANDAQQILAQLGEKINNKYSASKKH